jgi:RHS repeat-associated protein
VINDGDHGAPKAYLNVIVFDKDFKADLSKSLKVAITREGKYKPGSNHYGTHEQVSLPDAIAIAEPGYVFVYVSNETPQSEVYFDDLQIAHTTTPIVQKDDYYPFGGAFNSYTSGAENLYKFTGKEEQKETGLIDFGARMYDPMLGRWNHIDPLAMEYHDVSPYLYSMNNPIRFIDPDGNQVWDMTTDKAHKSALARFAQTEQGRVFLAQYAKAGDVIGGVKFTQDGKYSHQNVAFYSTNLGGRTRGLTRSYLRTKQSPRGLALGNVTKSTVRENLGGLDNLSFAVDIRNGLTEDEALETIGHESFIHVDKTTKDVEKGVADLKQGKFGSSEGLFEGFADFMSGLSGDESDHKLAVDGKAATMEEFVDALDQVTGGTQFRDMYNSWKEAEKKRQEDNH